MTSNDVVRKKLRAQRRALPAEIVSSTSATITQKIIQLSVFQNSQHIALYSAHENEIDPAEILRYAHTFKKNIFLPVLRHKNQFEFYLIDNKVPLQKNAFGILEPTIVDQKPLAAEKLELILVPLVAFDHQCNRLGRGTGYYDHYLQFTKKLSTDARPVLIGLAYEFQRVEKIIVNEWDVKMDMIVTEENFYQKGNL